MALPPLSGLVEVNTGVPVQVVFPGGNRLKVTVPVGLKPPVTVAVSEMEVPTGPPAEGVVAMVGVAACVSLVNVHAIGCAAAPVNVAVVPFTQVVVTCRHPRRSICTLTKVYPPFSVSVTVTVGVAPAGMVTAADTTPLAPLTAAVVTGEAIVLPLE